MEKCKTIKIFKRVKWFPIKALASLRQSMYVQQRLLKAEIIFNFDFILLRESWKGLCSSIW